MLCSSCPQLSDEAIERLDKALTILHNSPKASDMSAKSLRYDALMQKITPYKEIYDATEVLHKLQKKD